MHPTATSAAPVTDTSAANSHPESIRHLPAGARAAYADFQAGGDPAALTLVIMAILHDFSPHRATLTMDDLPGSTRLIEDLGFDSLAITEVVFAAEDLFRIRISNEEIARVGTLHDLCRFINAKMADRPVR